MMVPSSVYRPEPSAVFAQACARLSKHPGGTAETIADKSFLYPAPSGNKARRAVAKVEFHLGELFPRVGLIVTNLETDSRAVVRFY